MKLLVKSTRNNNELTSRRYNSLLRKQNQSHRAKRKPIFGRTKKVYYRITKTIWQRKSLRQNNFKSILQKRLSMLLTVRMKKMRMSRGERRRLIRDKASEYFCSICNNTDERVPQTQTDCGHHFHEICLLRLFAANGWWNDKCPNCRCKINSYMIWGERIQIAEIQSGNQLPMIPEEQSQNTNGVDLFVQPSPEEEEEEDIEVSILDIDIERPDWTRN